MQCENIVDTYILHFSMVARRKRIHVQCGNAASLILTGCIIQFSIHDSEIQVGMVNLQWEMQHNSYLHTALFMIVSMVARNKLTC